MSKNRVIETEFRDFDLLAEAVKALGVPCEIGRGLTLYGYEGKPRPEKADLAIRRQHVGPAANDLGFIRHPDGRVDAIISEYDLHGPGIKLLNKIKQEYAARFVEHQAAKIGARVHREKRADGSLVLRMVRR